MQVANAQTASNEATAQQSSVLANANQVTPYGNVSYAQPGGPNTQWTETTTLSPQEQGLFNSTTSAEQGALGIANNQLGRVSSALGQNITPGQMDMGVSPGSYQYSYDQGPALQFGYNPGQQVQGQVGSEQNTGQAVNQAILGQFGAGYSLLQPQLQQQTEANQAQLAAQGLNPNSAAYQNSMQLMGNQQAQELAQLAGGAVQAGDTEQNTLYGQQLQSGQFANQAAAQEYAQNQGLASFANTAAGQQYAQNQGAAQFYNTAQEQAFQDQLAAGQFQNQAQQQQFQQQAYNQELPINEFNSLMSSSQVQAPQASYNPTQVSPTNVEGAYQLSSDVAEQNYQQQLSNYSSALGGLFTLGGAGILKYSDQRLKRDVHEVGRRGPFKLYVYRLVGEERWREGVMAQEVQAVRPDCVSRDPVGWLMVDYERLAA